MDLSTHSILKLKLYSPASIQILVKIEGGASHEKYSILSGDSNINTWTELEFDFSSYANNNVAGGDMNTRIVFFVNAGVTTGTTTDVYYIDDIQWTN